MPKVSVIIPIYGVEKYIERCARSLMEQTLTDIEYIFINDCTQDQSIEILKRVISQYPERQDNIILTNNKTNVGQARTRRKGIMMAHGDYIIHCDPDDWVDNDWIKSLYRAASDNNADISWCGFESILQDGSRKYFPNRASDSIEDFLEKLEIGEKWGSMCLHLVRREIAQSPKIVWPSWNYCEDLAFIFQYAALAQSVSYVNRGLYKYRHNTESITSQRSRKGIIRNVEGEISASLQGLTTCHVLRLGNRHRSHLFSRIYRAKARLMSAATDATDFCKLWHECSDGLSFTDIWKSSLGLRIKIVTSLIYLNVYPYVKGKKFNNGNK